MLGAGNVRDSMPLFHNGSGGSSPTSALQLVVRQCSIPRAQELNRLWHSLLPITDQSNLVRFPKYCAYWADFDDIAYAVAIWTSPMAANRLTDGWQMLELRRFAIAPDAPKNTASRMLSIMKRLLKKRYPDLIRLISYQATEHHAGTIYKAAGWTCAAECQTVPWHNGKSTGAVQTASPKLRWESKV